MCPLEPTGMLHRAYKWRPVCQCWARWSLDRHRGMLRWCLWVRISSPRHETYMKSTREEKEMCMFLLIRYPRLHFDAPQSTRAAPSIPLLTWMAPEPKLRDAQEIIAGSERANTGCRFIHHPRHKSSQQPDERTWPARSSVRRRPWPTCACWVLLLCSSGHVKATCDA